MLHGCKYILDPFAGTGKIFKLKRWYPDAKIFGIEIQPEWAKIKKGIVIGNALYLPFPDQTFDAICTSPTYGNRMADHDEGTVNLGWEFRKTYASALQKQLHPDNSGAMQWGQGYRDFHAKAWIESLRVLNQGGKFVLNIKNHIRAGQEQKVTEWHIQTLLSMGLTFIDHTKIKTPSMKHGKNSELRVPYESVITFSK